MLRIRDLPIPDGLASLMEGLGYTTLYPPQEEAVKAGVLDGQNLLLTTPTASGKTLVAMLAAGKIVLEGRGKTVYLTPLRALANEKYNEFKALERLKKANGDNLRVLISTGDYDTSGESLGRGDVLVLTNEKFDSVLRHGVTWIDAVRLFVADEVHIVGDRDRGPTLEMVATKILTYASSSQILALSATIRNPEDLAKWLGAKLIDTKWRPIKLIEGVYDYGEVRFSDGSRRRIETTNRGSSIDVAIDALSAGGQSLIFAETRRRAVGLATKASEVTQAYLSREEAEKAKDIANEILSIGEETELSRTLSKVVERGAAFHHAGLANQHRAIVEDSFKNRLIKVLTATPTLAAGVNLPARRVVISSLMRYDSDYGGKAPISILEYKQMVGRAGRPRYDEVGETVIIPTYFMGADEVFSEYIEGEPEPLRSRLGGEAALRTHLLATIATLPGINDTEVRRLLSKSLLAIQYRPVTMEARVKRAMEYIMDQELVRKKGQRYIASEFGKRVATLYIDPVTGVAFRRAVEAVEEGKGHTLGLLHLIISTPDFTPKFPTRGRDVEEASMLMEDHKDEFLAVLPKQDALVYDALYEDYRTLLVLWGWINEWGENRLLDRLGVEPGDLHRAVETSEWLLYSLFEVSKLLGRSDLLTEIDDLRRRVKHGVKAELLPLVRLEGIGRVRARALHSHGFTDIDKLASAPVDRIAAVPKIGPTIARSLKKQLSGHR